MVWLRWVAVAPVMEGVKKTGLKNGRWDTRGDQYTFSRHVIYSAIKKMKYCTTGSPSPPPLDIDISTLNQCGRYARWPSKGCAPLLHSVNVLLRSCLPGATFPSTLCVYMDQGINSHPWNMYEQDVVCLPSRTKLQRSPFPSLHSPVCQLDGQDLAGHS